MPSSCLREGEGRARGAKHRQKSVAFDEEVEVLEFSRLLGGSGGVPTDGTWATLGLGEARGQSRYLLVFDETKEEAEHVPEKQRIPMLIAAMGKDGFDEVKRHERKAMMTLHRQRRKTEEEESEWDQMPSSAEEARKRAMKLASEAEVRRTWTGSHRMPRSRLEGDSQKMEAPAVVAGPPPLPPSPPRMLVRSNSAEAELCRLEPLQVPAAFSHAREELHREEPNRKPPAAREDEPAGAGILEVEESPSRGDEAASTLEEPPLSLEAAVIEERQEPQKPEEPLLEEAPSTDGPPKEPIAEPMWEESPVPRQEPPSREDDTSSASSPHQEPPLSWEDAIEEEPPLSWEPVEEPSKQESPPAPEKEEAQETEEFAKKPHGATKEPAEPAVEPAAEPAATAEEESPVRSVSWVEDSSSRPARWCDYPEEYHTPSHRQVLLREDDDSPRPSQGPKTHQASGAGRLRASPQTLPGRPKILQRQVKEEATKENRPQNTPHPQNAPPNVRGANVAVEQREEPRSTATSWLGSDPKIRILQRPKDEVKEEVETKEEDDEDEGEEEEEIVPPRRSWVSARCARAGKTERVITARYKTEAHSRETAIRFAQTGDGDVPRQVTVPPPPPRAARAKEWVDEAPTTRESRRHEGYPRGQGRYFKDTRESQGPVSSAAAWLGEQEPRRPDPRKSPSTSQGWKPSLRSTPRRVLS